MSRIKNWNKIKDYNFLVVWRNTRWIKTTDKWATIEEDSVAKSGLGGWNFIYFTTGKNNDIQKNNVGRSKSEAVKFAVDWMRSHPEGLE